jgi:uncharacterized protein YbcI
MDAKQLRVAAGKMTAAGMPPDRLRRPPMGNAFMKSQGEIEAAVCDVVSRFQQEYMGRGPRDIHTHLVDNKLFVHLQGVLTAAEQRLIEAHANGHVNERGAELLKQLRSHLVSSGRPLLEALVREVTGTPPVCVHHDISTDTGEEVIVFTLSAAPDCRGKKKK